LAEDAAILGEMVNAYRILIGKYLGKCPHGRARRSHQDSTNMEGDVLWGLYVDRAGLELFSVPGLSLVLLKLSVITSWY
jgi:hypothetical protein